MKSILIMILIMIIILIVVVIIINSLFQPSDFFTESTTDCVTLLNFTMIGN